MFAIACSRATVVVNVTLEREDEIAGPILAPFFPQVSVALHCLAVCMISAVVLLHFACGCVEGEGRCASFHPCIVFEFFFVFFCNLLIVSVLAAC